MTIQAAIADFEAALSVESKAVLADVVTFIKNAAKATVDELISITPVRTGAAKGNWQVTLDSPPAGPIDEYDLAPVGDSNTQTLARAVSVISGVSNTTRTIYISNLMPYISTIIEDGWSTQTPPGEFSAALQRLESRFS